MKRQKIITLSIVFVVLMLIFFGINNSQTIQTIEDTVLDVKFRLFQRDVEEPELALVLIDQQSLDFLSQEAGIYWPWPREVYSFMHNYLTAKGANLVVYDILFDQPDFDRPGFVGADSDRRFEGVLGINQNSVLSVFSNKTNTIEQNELIEPFLVHLKNSFNNEKHKVSNIPIEPLLNATAGLGTVTIENEDESVIRSIPLFIPINENKWLPSLSMAAYIANSQNTEFEWTYNSLNSTEISIPLGDDQRYLINWYAQGGGGLEKGSFQNYSFAAILAEAMLFAESGEFVSNSVLDVQDKTVFIGANAAGLSDIKSTPMSVLEPFPGVEIHATIFQNIMLRDFIKQIYTNDFWYIFPLLIISITLLIGIFYLDYKLNILISATLFIGVTFLGFYVFENQRIWYPTVHASLFMGFSLIISYVFKYVTEDAQKKKLRFAFSRYVQKEVVEKIVENNSSIKLGGERKELTIMFSDLEGFTKISENSEPEELVDFLNEYLHSMTDIVFRYNGTLDKYIGDAIMAFWGAPVDDPEHAVNACYCLLEMKLRMTELQERWKEEGKPVPNVRFGVNTGEVVVGNIGSEERFDYTVLGDQVNLAARLEPANKEYGTQILVSENTLRKLDGKFVCRTVGRLRVKGKKEPINIFELLSKAGDPTSNVHLDYIKDFDAALDLYYAKKFDDAATGFLELMKTNTDDKLIEFYLTRIGHYQAFPPPDDWDGVYSQISK